MSEILHPPSFFFASLRLCVFAQNDGLKARGAAEQALSGRNKSPRRLTRILSWILILAAVPLSSICTAQSKATITATDFTRICQNVRQTLLGSPTALAGGLPSSVEHDLQTQQPDGSWPDVNLADADIGKWKANNHLLKLERIARAYYGSHAGPADVPSRLTAGLTFWFDRDPKNPNWWFNEISTPREVAYILCMMGDDAPPALRERGSVLMKRANWARQTGANLLDETWIQVVRGCIEKSPTVTAEAFDRTWQELRIVDPSAEGIQADGSFHQHNALLYNSGYGTVLLECLLRFIAAEDGSSLTMPAEATSAAERFAIDGDTWMFFGKSWDFGACGRSICRVNATDSGAIKKMLAAFAAHAAPRSAELKASLAAGGPVGNRQFWCSDYMVQRRGDYFASVRMYSPRVFNTDMLTTNENRKSHHIADGATCLMLHGSEYFNLYPVWDWLRIPGTTVEQDTPLLPKTIKRHNKLPFVGGVSDGSVGCSAMDVQYNVLTAHKAWFCFDRAMVCLGAGIDCDTDHAVLTTLNQCVLNGPVFSDEGELHGTRTSQKTRWLWHDGIGYVLATPAKLEIKLGPQTGKWSDIGSAPSEPVTRDVFNVAINHGERVKNGSYAYIVLPASTRQYTETAEKALPFEIIANTPQLQAVRERSTGLMQIVFHQAGEMMDGSRRVSADKPCVLMVRPTANGSDVSVANPLNLPETVTVQIGGQTTLIELPGGMMAGLTVTRHLQANP